MRHDRPHLDKMQEETVQPQPAENLEQQLADAQAQVASQREAMLRALADAENARKRYQAEAATAQKYALERFAESLLPVMDSLEAALANKEASPEALRFGELLLHGLTGVFCRLGLNGLFLHLVELGVAKPFFKARALFQLTD